MHPLDFSGPPPRPQTLAEAQQIIDLLWRAYRELLAQGEAMSLAQQELRSRIEQLEEQQLTDSASSSKPPSSDTPEQRARRRKKPRSKRSRGAQPGHQKHERALLPEDEVDHIERYYPEGGCDCGQGLVIDK